MCLLESRLNPGRHSALEIALDLIEADPNERAARLFEIRTSISDEQDRAIVRDDPRSPHRKVGASTDVEGSRNVRSAEGLRTAQVDDDCILPLSQLLKCIRGERNVTRHAFEKCRPLSIDPFHAAVVVGELGDSRENAIDKLWLVVIRQEDIAEPFVAKSRLRTLGHSRSTE